MSKSVVLIGALDTKGNEYEFVKGYIENKGHETLTVDVGVLGTPAYAADVRREEVATAGGGNLEQLRSGEHKDQAMQVMARGAEMIASRLHREGRLDGILAMGGTGGTSIASRAMRALPIGVPKIMISTVGGGDVSAYSGSKDIVFFPSIVDVAGINRISRMVFTNAAAAMVGMLDAELVADRDEKPLVAASMFGNTTEAVDYARALLEDEGYEVLVFHATGVGGQTMESLITDGYLNGSFDLTTTELADYVCGGVFNAGPDRCLAAAKAGIPTLLIPGCVDMANFAGIETVPERYRERTLYQWNDNVTLLRTDANENRQIGDMLAAAANAAMGPVTVLLPLGGVSMLDSLGGEFWDPEADQACFDALRKGLNEGVQFIEVDANINEQTFVDRAVEVFLSMLESKS